MRIGLMKKKNHIVVPNKETIIEENDEILFFCKTNLIRYFPIILYGFGAPNPQKHKHTV